MKKIRILVDHGSIEAISHSCIWSFGSEKFGCLVVCLFYGISTFFGSFNAELNHFDEIFKKISSV